MTSFRCREDLVLHNCLLWINVVVFCSSLLYAQSTHPLPVS
jgi:hypothetical protein